LDILIPFTYQVYLVVEFEVVWSMLWWNCYNQQAYFSHSFMW